MQKIHYHNDFSVTLTLENMRVELIDEVIFYTRSRGSLYSCAYCCGTLTKKNEDTVICVLDGHNLEAGLLKYAVIFQIPDAAYPDGFLRVCQHHTTDIELVTGNGDTAIGTAIAVYNGNAECVFEFAKFVMGASFLEDAIEVEIGLIVFCNANKDLAGDYYHKFLINTDGTVDGLEIMLPYANKIYINATNGNCYRWSGSNLVEFSKSMVLGETNTTAYAGNKGKANAAAIALILEQISDYTTAVDEILEQLYKYTADYVTELPTDVPEFSLAKVTYGGLKSYSDLKEGDYVYRMYIDMDVEPILASLGSFFYFMLPSRHQINIGNSVLCLTPTKIWSVYFMGLWWESYVNEYQTQLNDVSGIITDVVTDPRIDWLKAYTKQDALYIYLFGRWQEILLR